MSEGGSNYADFYAKTYKGSLREHRVLGRAPLHLLRVSQPPGDASDDATSDLWIGRTLSGTPKMEVDLGSGRFNVQAEPEAFLCGSPGQATTIRLSAGCELMILAMPGERCRETVNTLSEGRLSALDFAPLRRNQFKSPLLSRATDLLWRLVAMDGVGGSALLIDSAQVMILQELLAMSSELLIAPSRRSGGLAAWQVKRACEAMDARLDGEVGLGELAAAAGCSPTHFSRAFKQSIGQPPFAWLLQRRIERAKELLADPGVPLAEVALAVGFAAQPQFTTAFRRVTGTTPGAWRRERLL